MVEGVNASTSKLLEQIKRLSAQADNSKGVDTRSFKKEVENSTISRANDIGGKVAVSHLEKVLKKRDVTALAMEGINAGEVRKTAQTPAVAQTSSGVERKRYKEPLGNLLDAYL